MVIGRFHALVQQEAEVAYQMDPAVLSLYVAIPRELQFAKKPAIPASGGRQFQNVVSDLHYLPGLADGIFFTIANVGSGYCGSRIVGRIVQQRA